MHQYDEDDDGDVGFTIGKKGNRGSKKEISAALATGESLATATRAQISDYYTLEEQAAAEVSFKKPKKKKRERATRTRGGSDNEEVPSNEGGDQHHHRPMSPPEREQNFELSNARSNIDDV